jgi:uncharacterized protein (TIGR02246 family)
VAVLLGVLVWLSFKPRRSEVGAAPESAPPVAPKAPPPRSDGQVGAIREAINQANAACVAALEAGDAHAYVQAFAEDSVSLPGHGPIVRGRTAIEDAMAAAFRKVRFSEAAWETIETRYNGKTAYETGSYRFMVRPKGRGPTQKTSGRYFVVWKKIGEEWKIMVDAAQPGAPAG